MLVEETHEYNVHARSVLATMYTATRRPGRYIRWDGPGFSPINNLLSTTVLHNLILVRKLHSNFHTLLHLHIMRARCLVRHLKSVISVISLPLTTQFCVSRGKKITNFNVLGLQLVLMCKLHSPQLL